MVDAEANVAAERAQALQAVPQPRVMQVGGAGETVARAAALAGHVLGQSHGALGHAGLARSQRLAHVL